jgi:catechol 2,3-dioxygenase-like lactoylglutathione lyase family enzyme
LIAILALAVSAAPPAEPVRLPTDVRRTTMIVASIDTSLKLYRDALGMVVKSDVTTKATDVAKVVGTPGAKLRVVMLGTNDARVGWLGLLEWLDPRLPDPGPYPRRLGIGRQVIVISSDRIDARCAAAAAVPGVTVSSPVEDMRYGAAAPRAPLRICKFFDPDGTLIELNGPAT